MLSPNLLKSKIPMSGGKGGGGGRVGGTSSQLLMNRNVSADVRTPNTFIIQYWKSSRNEAPPEVPR